MAFKKLNDAVRMGALQPFLQAADQMHGLCLCIATDKQHTTLNGGRPMFDQLVGRGILKARWTFESFDRMARATHFISLLLAGLSSEGQDICWISDEDEMFESPQKSEDTLRLLSTFQKMYVRWPLGKLSAGTTKLDEGDRFEEDFTAIADLAAGTLYELLFKLRPNSDNCVSDATFADLREAVSEKGDILLSWLTDTDQPLKRLALIFDRRADGKIRIAKL